MKPQAIIVDIDGTLANNDHRRHFVENKPKNWKAFNDGIKYDKVNEWCSHIIQNMCLNHHVILCSGREEIYRQVTLDWLQDEGICGYTKLFMRKAGDYRSDEIVKEEILDNLILPQYDVLFAVDDRPRVCRMWRKRGLVCLQCNDKEF